MYIESTLITYSFACHGLCNLIKIRQFAFYIGSTYAHNTRPIVPASYPWLSYHDNSPGLLQPPFTPPHIPLV